MVDYWSNFRCLKEDAFVYRIYQVLRIQFNKIWFSDTIQETHQEMR